MNFQIIHDGQGKDIGIFIPLNEWLLIKENYPDIETLNKDIPIWEKDLIDQRLDAIKKNPKPVRQGIDLLEELKRKV